MGRAHSPTVNLLHRRGGDAVAVQTAGPPALIPNNTTGFAEFSAPIGENRVLELHKIAVFGVVRVGKPPGKFATNWLVPSFEGVRVWG